MYQPTDNVTSEADIRAVIPDTFEAQEAKILDHLDPLCTAWIKNRPFSLWLKSTKTVASMCPPKAIQLDLCGFSMTKRWRSQIGPATTVMTDFSTSCPPVVSGSSFLSRIATKSWREWQRFGRARSRALRASLAVNGRVPDFAVLVGVEEAFLHCGKAIIRSKLWASADHGKAEGLPTYAEVLIAHGKLDRPLADMEAGLKHIEENRLYDE